jgi:hypothetical protein
LTSSRTAASRQTKTVNDQAILAADTVAIVATMAAPALTPDLALRYLGELSTDVSAAVLLDEGGSVAASSGAPEGLDDLSRQLFERAGEAHQIEVSTGNGAVYAVREHGWRVAVVTGRFALPALMFYDLRTILSDLGESRA